jgi:hypothetical protein
MIDPEAIKTITEALKDIKATLKLPLELRGVFETSVRSALCQTETLLTALDHLADAGKMVPDDAR